MEAQEKGYAELKAKHEQDMESMRLYMERMRKEYS